jgi:hypothetical protein
MRHVRALACLFWRRRTLALINPSQQPHCRARGAMYIVHGRVTRVIPSRRTRRMRSSQVGGCAGRAAPAVHTFAPPPRSALRASCRRSLGQGFVARDCDPARRVGALPNRHLARWVNQYVASWARRPRAPAASRRALVTACHITAGTARARCLHIHPGGLRPVGGPVQAIGIHPSVPPRTATRQAIATLATSIPAGVVTRRLAQVPATSSRARSHQLRIAIATLLDGSAVGRRPALVAVPPSRAGSA